MPGISDQIDFSTDEGLLNISPEVIRKNAQLTTATGAGQAAEDIQLGKNFGVSPAVVATDRDLVRSSVEGFDISLIVDPHKGSKKYLSNIDNMAVSRDDVGNLVETEGIFEHWVGDPAVAAAKFLPRIPYFVEMGVSNFLAMFPAAIDSAAQGVEYFTGLKAGGGFGETRDIFLDHAAATEKYMRGNLVIGDSEDLKGRTAWDDKSLLYDPEWLVQTVGDVIGSVVPALVAGYMSGGSSIVASVVGGGMEAGSLLGQMQREGKVSDAEATTAAFSFGIASFYLNKLGFDEIFGGKIAEALKTQLTKRLMNSRGKALLPFMEKIVGSNAFKLSVGATIESGTEWSEELAQAFIKGLTERGREIFEPGEAGALWGEIVDSMKNLEIIVGAFFAGGGMTYLGQHAEKQSAAEQADLDVKFFEALDTSVENSETRKRMPTRYEEYIKYVVEENEGTVEAVYVDAKLMQEAIPEAELPGILRDAEIEEVFEEALKLGGNVEIPIAKYAAHIAGSEASINMRADLKFRRDGMSANEAAKFNKEWAQEMEAEVKRFQQIGEAKTKFEEEQQQVYDDVLSITSSVGRSSLASQQYAELWAAYAGIFAKRHGEETGETPLSIYHKIRPQVISEQLQTFKGRGDIGQEGALNQETVPMAPAAPRVPFVGTKGETPRNVTWEAMPSPDVKTELTNASPEEVTEFTSVAKNIVRDEEGNDELADKVGIPLNQSSMMTGGYAGAITPNIISEIISNDSDKVEAYTLALQYIFKQNAAPWFQEGTGAQLSKGLKIEFNSPLTLNDEAEFFKVLQTALGKDIGYTKTQNNEITLINYRGDDGVPFGLPDADFTKAVNDLVANEGSRLGIKPNVKAFEAEGNYGYVHNWKQNPSGDDILQQPALAARPELHDWIKEKRSGFEDLLVEFAKNHIAVTNPEVDINGEVELTHWSNTANLSNVDPSYHGKGVKGEESKRKANDPDNWVDRSYYGLSAGKKGGYVPEPQLGVHRHTVKVSAKEIYDMAADPSGLKQSAENLVKGNPFFEFVNVYEKLIKEAGYKGYWVNSPSQGLTAALFEKTKPAYNGEDVVLYQKQNDKGILLPLSLPMFKNEMLQNKVGKHVKVETINQVIKHKDTKQIEKQIVASVLAQPEFKGQKSIPFNEFRIAIDSALIPWQHIRTTKHDDYGFYGIKNDVQVDEYVTIVYNSPILHGITGTHFPEVFEGEQGAHIRNVEYEVVAVPQQEDVWVAMDVNRPGGISTEDELAQYVGSAGSKESVENWVADLKKQTFFHKIGLTGHARRWDNNSRAERYMSELQSDFYQSNKASQVVTEMIWKNPRTKEQTKLKVRYANAGMVIDATDSMVKKVSKNIKDRQVTLSGLKSQLKKQKKLKKRYDNNDKHVVKIAWPYAEKVVPWYTTGRSIEIEGFPGTEFVLHKEMIVNDRIITESKKTWAVSEATSGLKILTDNSVDDIAELTRKKLTGASRTDEELSEYVEQALASQELITHEEMVAGVNKKISGEIDEILVTLEKDKLGGGEELKTYDAARAEQSKIMISEMPQTFTIQETQFVANRKNFEERMINEEIRAAANDSMTKLMFPFPHTCAVIEGFTHVKEAEVAVVQDGYSVERQGVRPLNPQDRISIDGEDGIILSASLGKHTFTAAKISDMNEIVYSEYVRGKLDEWEVIALPEIKSMIDKFNQIAELVAKRVATRGGEPIDVKITDNTYEDVQKGVGEYELADEILRSKEYNDLLASTVTNLISSLHKQFYYGNFTGVEFSGLLGNLLFKKNSAKFIMERTRSLARGNVAWVSEAELEFGKGSVVSAFDNGHTKVLYVVKNEGGISTYKQPHALVQTQGYVIDAAGDYTNLKPFDSIVTEAGSVEHMVLRAETDSIVTAPTDALHQWGVAGVVRQKAREETDKFIKEFTATMPVTFKVDELTTITGNDIVIKQSDKSYGLYNSGLSSIVFAKLVHDYLHNNKHGQGRNIMVTDLEYAISEVFIETYQSYGKPKLEELILEVAKLGNEDMTFAWRIDPGWGTGHDVVAIPTKDVTSFSKPTITNRTYELIDGFEVVSARNRAYLKPGDTVTNDGELGYEDGTYIVVKSDEETMTLVLDDDVEYISIEDLIQDQITTWLEEIEYEVPDRFVFDDVVVEDDGVTIKGNNIDLRGVEAQEFYRIIERAFSNDVKYGGQGVLTFTHLSDELYDILYTNAEQIDWETDYQDMYGDGFFVYADPDGHGLGRVEKKGEEEQPTIQQAKITEVGGDINRYDDFDFETLTGEQQPVVARYAEIQKYLKALRPDSYKVHTGSQGLRWGSIDITPEDAQTPIYIFQGEEDKARGSVNVFNEGETPVVRLFEGSDVSTFLHESGHIFTIFMGQMASQPNAPKSLKEEWQVLLDFVGNDGQSSLTTEQHEKLGDAIETYFTTGEAPSLKLRSTFQKFSDWLKAIYAKLVRKGAPISDEIKGVFDRMFASDAEIEEANAFYDAQKPFFEEADLMGEEKARYEKLKLNADGDAKEKRFNTYMKAFLQAQGGKKEIANQVADQINSMPVYVAMDTIVSVGGVSIELADEIVGKDARIALGKKRPGLFTKKGDVVPDLVAEGAGFTNVDEMFAEIAKSEPKKVLGEQMVKARMEEIEVEIRDSLKDTKLDADPEYHSDAKLNLLIAEVQMLQNKQRAKSGSKKAAITRVKLEAVKSVARQTLAGMPVRDASGYYKYSQAEAKAARQARKAYEKGDLEAAERFKRRELLNHAMVVEAVKIKDEVNKGVKMVNRKFKAKLIVEPEIDLIKDIAMRFGFKQKPPKVSHDQFVKTYFQWLAQTDSKGNLRKNINFVSWVQSQADKGYGVALADEVLDRSNFTFYKDMPVATFRKIIDSVNQIATIELRERQVKVGGKLKSLTEVVDTLVFQLSETYEGKEFDRFKESKTSFLSVIDAHLVKMEFLFEAIDGKPVGTWHEIIFQRLADAEELENLQVVQADKDIKALFDAHYTRKEQGKLFKDRILIPDISSSPTKGQILRMALDFGNMDNYIKRRDGEHWTDEQMEAVKKVLVEKDWKFVQSVWDYIEQYKEPSFNLEREMTGRTPDAILPTVVKTEFGDFPGGYFPVSFDPRFKKAKSRQEKQEALLYHTPNYAHAMTQHGFLKARMETAGKQAMSLELTDITRHVSGVIHDLTHREAVVDLAKIFNNKEFSSAATEMLGIEMYNQFAPWLKDIANTEPVHDIKEKVAKGLRIGTTVAKLGKFGVMFQQLAGFTQSIHLLGKESWRLPAAYARMFSTPSDIQSKVDVVMAKSKFMKTRVTHYSREAHDAFKGLNVYKKAPQALGEFAMQGIGMLQFMTDLPTWVAAYNAGIQNLVTEKKAVAYADSIVRKSQGGGGVKDLARVQRGSEFFRLMTMFYSFMNVAYQIFTMPGRGKGFNFTEFASAAFFVGLIGPMAAEILSGRPPDEDEDEDWITWTAKVEARFYSGLFPVIRDVAGAAGSGFDYKISPIESPVNTIIQGTSRAITDQDITKLIKPAAEIGGLAFRLPSDQMYRTGEAFYQWLSDNRDFKYHHLVYGGKY